MPHGDSELRATVWKVKAAETAADSPATQRSPQPLSDYSTGESSVLFIAVGSQVIDSAVKQIDVFF